MENNLKGLLCGGNTKFGKVFGELLKQHCDLTIPTREQLNSPEIIKFIDDDYDFIFFNHNRGSSGFLKIDEAIEIDVKLPYRIVAKQTKLRRPWNKVGWMTTGDAHLHMGYPTEQYSLDEGIQAYLLIKSAHQGQQRFWGQKYNTFVCDPGRLNEENYLTKAEKLLDFFLSDKDDDIVFLSI